MAVCSTLRNGNYGALVLDVTLDYLYMHAQCVKRAALQAVFEFGSLGTRATNANVNAVLCDIVYVEDQSERLLLVTLALVEQFQNTKLFRPRGRR